MFEDWVTLQTLAIFGSAAAVLRIIVQHTKKDVDRWMGKRLPTFWYAVLLAFLVITARDAFTGQVSFAGVFLNVLNAFLLAVATKTMGDDKPKVSK